MSLRYIMGVKLVVTSSVAGRHRGGAVFTGAMTFDPDHFTPAQLKAIIADPVLTVVAGNVIRAENVEEYFDQVALSKAFQAATASGNGLTLTAGHPDDPAPAEPVSTEEPGEETEVTEQPATDASGGKKHSPAKGKAGK